MERAGTAREYTLWSIGMILILLFALIPVVWIVSLSLKDPATIADQKLLPAGLDVRELQDAVRGRPSRARSWRR